MYQSLYRIFRPRRFSEMTGQETVVRTLRNQAATGRFAHAYLFCGSRGTGKTSAARIMASAINCEHPDHGDPCLECSSCRQLAGEATLDVYEMDAASNSRVEEIREMLEKVNYPPQFVKNKVYIIDEAHMLSTAAFNALLKTLEEPPAYMVFILATTEPQKIPATIHSRCQRFDFGRLSEEDIVTRLQCALQDGKEAQVEALRLIAAYAEGSMRDAWSMMDVCLGLGGNLTEESARLALGASEKPFLIAYLDAVLHRDIAAALRLTDELMRQGRDALVFLRDLSSHVRQVLSVAFEASPQRDTTEENLLRLRRQAQEHRVADLVFLLEQCARAESEFRWASSQRAALELFALRACRAGESTEPSVSPDREGQPAKSPRILSSSAQTDLRPALSDAGTGASGKPPPSSEESGACDATAVTSPQNKPAPGSPISPPSPPAAPLPKDVWNTMLHRAAKELPSIHPFLQEGKFGGFKDGVFKLLLPKNQLSLIAFLHASDKREALQRILSEEAGTPVSFVAIGEDSFGEKEERQSRANRDIHALSAVFGRENIIVKDIVDPS